MTVAAQHRDVTLPAKPAEKPYRDYTSDTTPFWFAIEADGGSSIMESRTNMQYVTLTATGGYSFSEYLRVGLGFGGKMYVNNAGYRDTDSKFGIPVFANVRGNIISAYDRDGVPFWSLNIGTITHEGLLLNPTIGYSFGGVRNKFLIGLSYTLSTFKNHKKESQAYSYFGLKLGYEF